MKEEPTNEELERELAALLERLPEAQASPEFRELLRRAFLQLDVEGDEADFALRAALETLSGPPARDEFREDLRASFIQASFADADADEPRVPGSARRQSTRWRFLVGSVLATAAAVLFFVFTGGGPTWSVPSETLEVAEIEVDGRSLAELTQVAAREAILSGGVVTTGETDLRLQLGDLFVVELGHHSQVDLKRENDGSGQTVIGGEAGSIRVATGPDFPGHSLLVVTPLVEAEVTGTIFAIDILAAGTCVCCLESEVQVQSTANRLSITSGGAVFVDKKGLPHPGPTMSDHVEPLARLATFWN